MDFPSPFALRQQIPLSAKGIAFIEKRRKEIEAIFDRHDPRCLIIMGPCSIHHVDEALLYAEQFKELSEEVEESALLIMRAYLEKSRTSLSWKGLIHDPHLNNSQDIAAGLVLARTLLTHLAEMGVATATEFVSPFLVPYLEDLFSYGSIGARTTTSQTHRILASHLPMPIGIKNSVDGNIEHAIHGVLVARHSHTFLQVDGKGRLGQVKSRGNPYAHVILRGGESGTNYEEAHVQRTLEKMRRLEIPPRVLIDCSHGNAQGNYFQQKKVFYNVLEQLAKGNRQILGMMLESNHEASSQTLSTHFSELQPGVSITDPCLDFSTSAELIASISSSVISLTQS